MKSKPRSAFDVTFSLKKRIHFFFISCLSIPRYLSSTSSTSSMSASLIGSKANGNEEVQRAANARKGLFSPAKSFRSSSATSFDAYLKWKTFRWRRSKTTVSDSRMGRGIPSMSVVVINRSISSTNGESSPLGLVFSIPSSDCNNFKYIRWLFSSDCGGDWFAMFKPDTDLRSLMSTPISPSLIHNRLSSSMFWSFASALAR